MNEMSLIETMMPNLFCDKKNEMLVREKQNFSYLCFSAGGLFRYRPAVGGTNFFFSNEILVG